MICRVFLAGTKYCLDLSDHGNPNPGTPVTLWGKWEGGTNQTWRFEEGAFLFAFSFAFSFSLPAGTVSCIGPVTYGSGYDTDDRRRTIDNRFRVQLGVYLYFNVFFKIGKCPAKRTGKRRMMCLKEGPDALVVECV